MIYPRTTTEGSGIPRQTQVGIEQTRPAATGLRSTVIHLRFPNNSRLFNSTRTIQTLQKPNQLACKYFVDLAGGMQMVPPHDAARPTQIPRRYAVRLWIIEDAIEGVERGEGEDPRVRVGRGKLLHGLAKARVPVEVCGADVGGGGRACRAAGGISGGAESVEWGDTSAPAGLLPIGGTSTNKNIRAPAAYSFSWRLNSNSCVSSCVSA